jgi:hypothetical protein
MDAAGNGHVDRYGDDQMDYWTEALRFFDPASATASVTRPRVRIDADVLDLPHAEVGRCDGPAVPDGAPNTGNSE